MHPQASVLTSSGFAIFEIINSRSLLKIGAKSAWRLGEICMKNPCSRLQQIMAGQIWLGCHCPELTFCNHMACCAALNTGY